MDSNTHLPELHDRSSQHLPDHAAPQPPDAANHMQGLLEAVGLEALAERIGGAGGNGQSAGRSRLLPPGMLGHGTTNVPTFPHPDPLSSSHGVFPHPDDSPIHHHHNSNPSPSAPSRPLPDPSTAGAGPSHTTPATAPATAPATTTTAATNSGTTRPKRGRKSAASLAAVATVAGGGGGEGENGQDAGTSAVASADVDWNRARKDNHKEVERRRRETINEGINQLSRLVPGCEKNKGQILSRAAEHILELKNKEASNIEKWTLEKLLMDNAMTDLQRECDSWKAEALRWQQRAYAAGWTQEMGGSGSIGSEGGGEKRGGGGGGGDGEQVEVGAGGQKRARVE